MEIKHTRMNCIHKASSKSYMCLVIMLLLFNLLLNKELSHNLITKDFHWMYFTTELKALVKTLMLRGIGGRRRRGRQRMRWLDGIPDSRDVSL